VAREHLGKAAFASEFAVGRALGVAVALDEGGEMLEAWLDVPAAGFRKAIRDPAHHCDARDQSVTNAPVLGQESAS
jgi:hypothetical protein